ncbi:MAG TPA: hypothetical protein VFV19_06900 [Candidatus Polarisedimenticolaceae bacterium]|nr:hypothetical protein [Candidatus Polarisedimenticolaceae bacterium]
MTGSGDRANVHTLDDLLDARKRIVAAGSGEFAEIDARLAQFPRQSRLAALERRGERRSLAQRGRVVGYADRAYPVALGVVLVGLLVVNLLALAWGRWLAAIPIVLQSLTLIALLSRHYSQVILVRVWAWVMGIAGGASVISFAAGWLAMALATSESEPSPLRAVWWFPIGVIEVAAAVWFNQNAARSTLFEHAEDEPSYARGATA